MSLVRYYDFTCAIFLHGSWQRYKPRYFHIGKACLSIIQACAPMVHNQTLHYLPHWTISSLFARTHSPNFATSRQLLEPCPPEHRSVHSTSTGARVQTYSQIDNMRVFNQ